MDKLLERFLTYVKIDTQSDENSVTTPSTEKQCNLAKILVEELKQMGLKDVTLDPYCYVYATLPANSEKKVPTIGFIAHMDTSPDYPADRVNPQIIENYDGRDIVLNKAKNMILSPRQFPALKKYIGQTLITTDGNTLLGADDKAGVAEIMTAVEYLIQHPEIKHGTIKIAFTPDEEIGRGTEHFNLKFFGADFAYTVDGGPIGELEYENFNAAKAVVSVRGRSVHPGYAKDKMINAQLIAMEFNSLLPPHERPEHTQDHEGFFHLLTFDGSVDKAKMTYIIRDHDKEKFERKKQLMKQIANFINFKYNQDLVEVELQDQYYNMKEKIEPVMYIVDLAKQAMIEADVVPIINPVRGGTDGAMLSFKGLPTPNIFTGGHNFHGPYEFIPLQSMEKAVRVIVNIISLAHENLGK